MTTPLFRHPQIFTLPKRGAFTASEAVSELREFIERSLKRFHNWHGRPAKAADIGPSAQRLFNESAADLEKLLPYLVTGEDAAEAERVHAIRDCLRELFGDNPAAPEPFVTTSETQQIEAEAADLRASIYRQIGIAYVLTREAGPAPLADEKRAHLCEAWQCMARTLINTVELPGLDDSMLDALDALGAAADSLRAHLDDGQPQLDALEENAK